MIGGNKSFDNYHKEKERNNRRIKEQLYLLLIICTLIFTIRSIFDWTNEIFFKKNIYLLS